jgi:cytosine/creatinine deaminase
LFRQHGVELVVLNDAECIQLMAEFIRAHPDLWSEDIGK